MAEQKVLYRYESNWIEDQGPYIYVIAYPVIRETEKSYVIEGQDLKKETFILKSHGGKRFAYDTLEAAYEGYFHRCRRRELITRNQWERSKEVYKVAQDKEALLSLEPRSNELW